MKRPKIGIKTLGGYGVNFEYGGATGDLYSEGKIGVTIEFGRGKAVIIPEDVKKLADFFTVCHGILQQDNTPEMCKSRKKGNKWYKDDEMEKAKNGESKKWIK